MNTCEQCGAGVVWVRDIYGRWQCFNAGTDIDHWDSCSKRRWEQTVATGTPFENEKSVDANGKPIEVSGYANSVHGTKLRQIDFHKAKAKGFHPFQHQPGCEALPWETCDCPGPRTGTAWSC